MSSEPRKPRHKDMTQFFGMRHVHDCDCQLCVIRARLEWLEAREAERLEVEKDAEGNVKVSLMLDDRIARALLIVDRIASGYYVSLREVFERVGEARAILRGESRKEGE